MELPTQHSALRTQNSILTLSQLTSGIAKVFEESFPGSFWIKAEVAKLNHYPGSGHCYPSLVEKEKGTIRAEIRGTIWANDFMRINQKFIQVTGEPLKEGIQILFRALVKYHPVYGLSLQISDIDPSYTLGEMAKEKMDTVLRLKNEGLFERNRQLALPLLPKKIAIISVRTSKGFSDFINILEHNAWGYSFSCFLFPALLQGDKAVDSIIGQLKRIGRFTEHFDAVAILRGGGGEVGLSCYDNYQVAREVALCPLPVLTGIGHSTNETVVEMVAGYNKITPTDVAYFLVQQFHNFSARIGESSLKMINFGNKILEEEKRRWEEMSKRFILQTDNLVRIEKNRLEQVSAQTITGSRIVLAEHKHKIALAASRLRYKPGLLLSEKHMDLKNRLEWFGMRVKQLMMNQHSAIDKLDQHIHLIDPGNILKRGYSITYLNGKPLMDIAGLKQGDTIITRLHKGNISSEIKSVTE
ncbi:MAG: exodeoxyribonuclease VII large subunit [Bacteroidales bacterium]|nr:exodeoxyribonuclease VII large subunit [Bacteroidales bacterium]